MAPGVAPDAMVNGAGNAGNFAADSFKQQLRSLRLENSQLRQSVADLKSTDDAEIDRLWQLIVSRELQLRNLQRQQQQTQLLLQQLQALLETAETRQNAPDACNVLQTCVAVISALSDFTSTLDVAPLQQQLRHLVAQVQALPANQAAAVATSPALLQPPAPCSAALQQVSAPCPPAVHSSADDGAPMLTNKQMPASVDMIGTKPCRNDNLSEPADDQQDGSGVALDGCAETVTCAGVAGHAPAAASGDVEAAAGGVSGVYDLHQCNNVNTDRVPACEAVAPVPTVSLAAAVAVGKRPHRICRRKRQRMKSRARMAADLATTDADVAMADADVAVTDADHAQPTVQTAPEQEPDKQQMPHQQQPKQQQQQQQQQQALPQQQQSPQQVATMQHMHDNLPKLLHRPLEQPESEAVLTPTSAMLLQLLQQPDGEQQLQGDQATACRHKLPAPVPTPQPASCPDSPTAAMLQALLQPDKAAATNAKERQQHHSNQCNGLQQPRQQKQQQPQKAQPAVIDTTLLPHSNTMPASSQHSNGPADMMEGNACNTVTPDDTAATAAASHSQLDAANTATTTPYSQSDTVVAAVSPANASAAGQTVAMPRRTHRYSGAEMLALRTASHCQQTPHNAVLPAAIIAIRDAPWRHSSKQASSCGLTTVQPQAGCATQPVQPRTMQQPQAARQQQPMLGVACSAPVAAPGQQGQVGSKRGFDQVGVMSSSNAADGDGKGGSKQQARRAVAPWHQQEASTATLGDRRAACTGAGAGLGSNGKQLQTMSGEPPIVIDLTSSPRAAAAQPAVRHHHHQRAPPPAACIPSNPPIHRPKLTMSSASHAAATARSELQPAVLSQHLHSPVSQQQPGVVTAAKGVDAGVRLSGDSLQATAQLPAPAAVATPAAVVPIVSAGSSEVIHMTLDWTSAKPKLPNLAAAAPWLVCFAGPSSSSATATAPSSHSMQSMLQPQLVVPVPQHSQPLMQPASLPSSSAPPWHWPSSAEAPGLSRPQSLPLSQMTGQQQPAAAAIANSSRQTAVAQYSGVPAAQQQPLNSKMPQQQAVYTAPAPGPQQTVQVLQLRVSNSTSSSSGAVQPAMYGHMQQPTAPWHKNM
eukprot:jgi/Chrzof1/2761/Cz11g28090.t1